MRSFSAAVNLRRLPGAGTLSTAAPLTEVFDEDGSRASDDSIRR